MLFNYFKTAWRTLLKNKFNSVITIGGLTLGLAIGLLILLWVKDEKSYDTFAANGRQIYKLENMAGTGSSRQLWTNTNAAIGPLGVNAFPQIQSQVRTTYDYTHSIFRFENKSFQEDYKFFVDSNYFRFMNFPLVAGDPEKPFTDNQSIVLSRRMAEKYFGTANAVGKTLIADDTIPLRVSGIIANPPANSSFRLYEMLLPMAALEKYMYAGEPGKAFINDFNQYNYNTYLTLHENTSLKDLSVRLRDLHLQHKADDTDIEYLFLPLEKMHLFRADGGDNGYKTVQLFTLIAVLILVIACINYVNLSTARSLLRAKEVSLRKISGANRSQLFLQFIVETTLLFAIATTLALALIPVLLPYFNQLSGKELEFGLTDTGVWKLIGLTTLGTLVLSSIYPAVLLSSFEPLKAIKGKITPRFNDVLFRKGLVVVQFCFSIMLIAGTIVIGRQLKFIREKSLGYNKDQVFSFTMREMGNHYDVVKASLEKQQGISAVTRSDNNNIVSLGSMTGNTDFDGKEPNSTFMIHVMAIDKDFLPFFKMDLAKGNNFTGSKADSSHVILNETAVREANLGPDPIGKRFRIWQNNATIIGVVKDFHYASMKDKIGPVVMFYNPNVENRIYIRTRGGQAQQAIAAAEKSFKQYNSNYPFKYAFLDETYDQLYRSETRVGNLFKVFAAIAVFISCLGLLGLTAYAAQVRLREIGIRKVLGASTTGIVRLLAGDFIRLVLLAIVIGSPVAWWFMSKWLEDFAYRAPLSVTVFFWSGIAAVGIALITISLQSLKAALTNPVKTLRSE
ncbi:ABC transporter permease [Flavihumibacter petaseus]|uniref:Putative ABC transporter permease protein n=1 Tax=Flavihumibacter petaseus NBRC 106054 TaxID=1220578 RepID=A0A0E9N1T2_9BACT|nr:ABC transporter permease [Flavihumibacter petaseus]GAO43300.1 putative ABC transporter permease protein [Flavihumibacter petaseus NBRC 106054]